MTLISISITYKLQLTGTKSLDNVEMLSIENESKKYNSSYWCQRDLSTAPVHMEGSIMTMVNMHDFVESHLRDDSFTSPHNSVIQDRAIMCGGADTDYNITKFVLGTKKEYLSKFIVKVTAFGMLLNLTHGYLVLR